MRPSLSMVEQIELLVYKLGIFFYGLLIQLVQFFIPKAKQFMLGRKKQWDAISRFHAENKHEKILWIHCASLGEFDQGRPIIEKLKEKHPHLKIALTFFSPSGYEIRKDYPHADWIGYLPLDTQKNARHFFDLLQPSWAIIVKYEFWLQHFLVLQNKNVPIFLVGSVFRKKQVFFAGYGGLFRKVLAGFEHIFVQDAASLELLKSIDIQQVSVAGDPRIDSVLSRVPSHPSLVKMENFIGNQPVFIIGSSWLKDMQVLNKTIDYLLHLNWKVILAPHDISPKNIQAHVAFFPKQSVKYSELKKESSSKQILIIDNIGMLAALYQYGKIAYIGGGFGVGIHSTLEPAAFALPILFGPKYEKFIEANYFVQHKGAFCVHSDEELLQRIKYLLEEANYQKASRVVRQFMENNRGSTKTILRQIKIDN